MEKREEKKNRINQLENHLSMRSTNKGNLIRNNIGRQSKCYPCFVSTAIGILHDRIRRKEKTPQRKRGRERGKKEKLCLSIYPFIYTQVSSTSTFFNDLCLNQCSLNHDSPALNQ